MQDGIAPEDTHIRPRRSDVLASLCVECRNEVDVDVRRRVVEGPHGSRGTVTYADTDIVVWLCPACRHTNVDTAGG